MRGLPLLSGGAVTQPLAIAENLFLSSKVYSEGGENALHAHQNDDHAFFVLAGRARFFDDAGGEIEVGSLEGILIPRGVSYRFQSIPPDNLVILRMAGAEDDYYTLRSGNRRLAPDGSLLDSKDPRNGTPAQPVIERGEFFGA
jgi:quercetin dioxygenase-like cupin family protein